jgi:hypothetical protein
VKLGDGPAAVTSSFLFKKKELFQHFNATVSTDRDGKVAEKEGEVRRPAWILGSTLADRGVLKDLEDKKGTSPDRLINRFGDFYFPSLMKIILSEKESI